MENFILLIPIILMIAMLILIVITIPKILQDPNLNRSDKYLWILAIICFPFLGMFLYTLMIRKKY